MKAQNCMAVAAHMNEFQTSFCATNLEARDGLSRVATALQSADVSSDRRGDIEIALAEAINNIVEHAFCGLRPGIITVSVQWDSVDMCIRIFDSGTDLTGKVLPPGLPPNLDVARSDLPEGGFGWFLIRQLATSVDYRRQDNWNILSLVFSTQ